MVVEHLGAYLPRATDLFNNTFQASSATVGAGNVLTVVTTASHGLSVNDVISIGSAIINIPITTYSILDEVITFECSVDHDLTEPRQINDQQTIELAGFTDAVWNDTFSIVSVPNRFSFSINVPSGASAPVLNTNEVLRSERPLSVFGLQTVATVPDATSFTVDLSDNVPDMDGLSFTSLTIATSVRIYAASDLARAEEMYTKSGNNELYMFVIMGDLDVSKDRHSISDAYGTFTSADQMRLRLLQNFFTLIFFPSSDSVAGENAQELAYGEVYSALLRVLYGFGGFAVDTDQSTFVTVSTGHGIMEYRKAYYMHTYDWQLPVDITIDNGFNFYSDVAFRDINGTFPMNTPDNEEKLTLAINLDDEPV